jgi:hypothetical protein
MEKLKSLGMKIGAKVDALRATRKGLWVGLGLGILNLVVGIPSGNLVMMVTGGLLIVVDGYDLWKAK